MIKIPYIFKSVSLGNLSSSAGGIKMTLRQYCEENVLDKEKKKSMIWTSMEWSNPSGPLRFELLQLDTLQLSLYIS